MHRITVPIRGMSCGGCVRGVQRALESIPGVHVEAVSVGSATVSVDGDIAGREDVLAAIRRAGYAPVEWTLAGA
ncbi:MAG TPA: heavy-metal-associated domain-containing protein [Gemmatimonadaceae bacterium]|nr:heavy-metal-associated domain-containing protein [Gemmatimonadaceae bacterium]